jgi:energy-coupling factor transporter transmembrane protein EcfT
MVEEEHAEVAQPVVVDAVVVVVVVVVVGPVVVVVVATVVVVVVTVVVTVVVVVVATVVVVVVVVVAPVTVVVVVVVVTVTVVAAAVQAVGVELTDNPFAKLAEGLAGAGHDDNIRPRASSKNLSAATETTRTVRIAWKILLAIARKLLQIAEKATDRQ